MNKLYYILFCFIILSSCKKDNDDLLHSPHSGNSGKQYLEVNNSVNYLELMPITMTANNVVLSAPPNFGISASYLWSPSSQTDSVIEVKQPGTYTVRVITQYATSTDTVVYGILLKEDYYATNLFIPNTFTPNGDGQNDAWKIIGRDVDLYCLKVYNKNDKLIFKTNDFTNSWTGNIKNSDNASAPWESYRYSIQVKFYTVDEIKTYSGYVKLIR